MSGHEKFRKTAEYQLLLGTIALPGCLVGALLINRLGRRNLMMLGFTGYLIIGLSVGLAYDKLLRSVPAFVVLYGLMQSFGNMGPGDTLGLVSAESYATPVRGAQLLPSSRGRSSPFLEPGPSASPPARS